MACPLSAVSSAALPCSKLSSEDEPLPAGMLCVLGGLVHCLGRLDPHLLTTAMLSDRALGWMAGMPATMELLILGRVDGEEELPLCPHHGLGWRGCCFPDVLDGGVDGLTTCRFLDSLILLLGD